MLFRLDIVSRVSFRTFGIEYFRLFFRFLNDFRGISHQTQQFDGVTAGGSSIAHLEVENDSFVRDGFLKMHIKAGGLSHELYASAG